MTMRVLSAIFVLSAAVVCSVPARAQSQPWLEDRRVGGGIGLRTGNLELHPGVAGEVGYDTNFYQSAGKVTPAGQVTAGIPGSTGYFNEPEVGVMRFRVTPSLTLKTLGPQRTEGDSNAT